MFEVNNFDSIKIDIASPEKIRSWSSGEVLRPETINYRTQKPEADGLFCQKIFGPIKDWECACGKYKKHRFKGIVCDKCGVKLEKSKVRRERMGHIELASPVAHLWYLKGIPSRIATILDMPPKEVEAVVYYASYVVMDPKATPLLKKQVLNDQQYRDACNEYGEDAFTVGMGAECVKELLKEVDIDREIKELREAIAKDQAGKKENSQAPKRMKMTKKLEIVEAFKATGSRPEWMILDCIPVLPPDLRPMVPLDGGRYATSDLNDLYRFVISRNRRLKGFLANGGVDAMIRNEKRMLQVAVDNLIDNSKRAKTNATAKNREHKSLTSLLKGKQGRFRQNLLGKRVDYSGRSVIVVGPELKLYQCGLPKEMALELFKPFIMKELVSREICSNIKQANKFVQRGRIEVWDVLEYVIKDHPVLLNRAPTLHRLGIQAFEPVLVEGRAIKIHPLVCTAFNADFDGDQMAVHVPLSIEAQAEARFLMLSTNNILKLSDGNPIVTPTQDMVLGSFYLTLVNEAAKGAGKAFMSTNEAKMAYQSKVITLQSPIRVRMTKVFEGEEYTKKVDTTVGRIIFNEAIPQDLGFVKRSKDNIDSIFAFETDVLGGDKDDKSQNKGVVDKNVLKQIVDKCFKVKGSTETSEVLDRIKSLGYKYSTIGAITTSVFDMTIPPEKASIIKDAEEKVEAQHVAYLRGFVTDEERYKNVIDIWTDTTKDVQKALQKTLGKFNPIKMMERSGARGSIDQIRQLAGMRGLMVNPSGRTIELPVKANFREGLSSLEYFISSHGGRKGLADTALKTAESGYLTRRLVDIAQPIIITELDCGDRKGIEVEEIRSAKGKGDIIEELVKRLPGRYTVADIVNPKTGEIVVAADCMITDEQAQQIVAAGITTVKIRSALTCKSRSGICAKCYGKNMASGNIVKIGEAVGTIAAQSIGEPGTQLTMRTFHTGGVATGEDITQGLPRVEELFEVRPPKNQAIIADARGTIYITSEKDKNVVLRLEPDNGGEPFLYTPNFNAKIIVNDGEFIQLGQPLTQGSINLRDLLRIKGYAGVQKYLVREVKDAYRLSGVEINDKHIEIIIRQMLRKVKVEFPGDTALLPGELIDIQRFDDINSEVLANGGAPATVKREILGISKASLASESFLAAASFQETTRVLTEAAIKGKIDPLIGLKENVLLGKLIPCGTGLKQYNTVTTTPIVPDNAYEEMMEDDISSDDEE